MVAHPDYCSHLTPKGGPSKLRVAGPFTFFHHIPTVITLTDTNPRMRENGNPNWSSMSVPADQNGS
jgi:hypothetical protein